MSSFHESVRRCCLTALDAGGCNFEPVGEEYGQGLFTYFYHVASLPHVLYNLSIMILFSLTLSAFI